MGYRLRDPELDRRCAFCGRPQAEVRKLVAGPQIFICDRCIAVCKQLLRDERPLGAAQAVGPRMPKPRELTALLDEWVVGQKAAKRVLAVAVYNHLKRVALRGRTGDVELTKGNVLLLGPPGTGKTHLARTLARILDVPFALADATPLTQAGYVGEDCESILAKLLRAADHNAERAATGIIYIDEIDKLARRAGHDRDVSGEGVQQGLLKILEGKRAAVRMASERGTIGGETIELDTSNILFIAGGAFDGLAKSIEARTKPHSGFLLGHREAQLSTLLPEDLHQFGFLPEFIGRFPVMVALHPLDEEMLVHILTQPRDALIRQYQRLFAMDGAQLECTPDGLLAVARRALAQKTGARGLRAVLEDLLLESMFELPSGPRATYVLDAEAVEAGRLVGRDARTAA